MKNTAANLVLLLTCLAVMLTICCLSPSTFGQTNSGEKTQTAACIAIVTPTLEGTIGSAAETANQIRELMASYLKGPSIKVVLLEAKLPSQAAEEAKQKDCQPILISSMTRKPGNNHGLMKALGRGAAASSWSIPYGGSTGGALAHAGTAGGLQAASALAEQTKAKDEVRLEYKLISSGGETLFGPKTEQQVAKSDGEDLVTPLVTRAAQAILGRAGK